MTLNKTISTAAMVLALLMSSGDLVAGDLVTALQRERAQNRAATIDATHIVTAQIPIGTEERVAKQILESNEFKLQADEPRPDGSYRLLASYFSRATRSMLWDEYRVVLDIEGGRVVVVFGRIFLQAL